MVATRVLLQSRHCPSKFRATESLGTIISRAIPPAALRYLPRQQSFSPSPSPFFTSAISRSRPYSSAANTKMASVESLIQAAQTRRSIYQLGKSSPVPDSKVEELINISITNVPSAFNTQSTRLVLLLHQEHERLWDLVADTMANLVKTGAIPEAMWKDHTLPKLKQFQNAVGTVLFYEDPAHIVPYAEKYSTYKDHFEQWAEHSNAMHQYFLWTALEALGFGANLQHYNPLIDLAVAKQWNLPHEWRLIAQLVFGSREGDPLDKTTMPIEDRVRIFGKQQ